MVLKMNELYIKSPLNYVGGKYKILNQIMFYLINLEDITIR